MAESRSHLLLDQRQTYQKIKRIAYEIYEQNFTEKEVILAGVRSNGYRFAELLKRELNVIAPFKVRITRVGFDSANPLHGIIENDISLAEMENKSIIVTDDVMNTGKTLVYSLKPFLDINVSKLQVAVIVDRGYKLFPVSADYVGYALSTTIQEHIEVYLDDDHTGVYLK